MLTEGEQRLDEHPAVAGVAVFLGLRVHATDLVVQALAVDALTRLRLAVHVFTWRVVVTAKADAVRVVPPELDRHVELEIARLLQTKFRVHADVVPRHHFDDAVADPRVRSAKAE